MRLEDLLAAPQDDKTMKDGTIFIAPYERNESVVMKTRLPGPCPRSARWIRSLPVWGAWRGTDAVGQARGALVSGGIEGIISRRS